MSSGARATARKWWAVVPSIVDPPTQPSDMRVGIDQRGQVYQGDAEAPLEPAGTEYRTIKDFADDVTNAQEMVRRKKKELENAEDQLYAACEAFMRFCGPENLGLPFDMGIKQKKPEPKTEE